jgi:hypothetical protein
MLSYALSNVFHLFLSVRLQHIVLKIKENALSTIMSMGMNVVRELSTNDHSVAYRKCVKMAKSSSD